MKLVDPTTAARVARRILIHINTRILESTGPGTIPNYCHTAKPWLRAIAETDFGLEDPASCVLYALDNLTAWRGAEARLCKEILRNTLSKTTSGEPS